MLYAFICTDKPNSLEKRLENRPAHLAWLEVTVGVFAAGPILDRQGNACGSLLIVEHNDIDAAKAWSEQDPYSIAGLFESVEIRPWKKVVGN